MRATDKCHTFLHACPYTSVAKGTTVEMKLSCLGHSNKILVVLVPAKLLANGACKGYTLSYLIVLKHFLKGVLIA